ncbi:MAG: transposase [Anaerovoracaceae bacterium]
MKFVGAGFKPAPTLYIINIISMYVSNYNRRSIRLRGYDYSQEGAYFITICCQDKIHRFGTIAEGKMMLNEYGEIALAQWYKLQDRFINIQIDIFQIMPNHIHGIVVLTNPVGVGLAPTQNSPPTNIPTRAGVNPAPTNIQHHNTIGDIVRTYKSLVANECLQTYKTNHQTMGKLWQRNYYEHIIRDEQSYYAIAEYIENNPAHWDTDEYQ